MDDDPMLKVAFSPMERLPYPKLKFHDDIHPRIDFASIHKFPQLRVSLLLFTMV